MKKILILLLGIAIIAISAVNVNYSLAKGTVLSNLKLQSAETLAQGEDPCDHTLNFMMVTFRVTIQGTGETVTLRCCVYDGEESGNACNFGLESDLCDEFWDIIMEIYG